MPALRALLGTPQNGRWLLAPADTPARVTRHYRDRTLILETEFETADGAVTLVDFMPLRGKHSHIVRLVQGKRGKVRMAMDLTIRFDYGRTIPWVTRLEDGTMRAIAGPDMIALRTPARLKGENLETVSEFTVSEGETIPFVLSYGASHGAIPPAVNAERCSGTN